MFWTYGLPRFRSSVIFELPRKCIWPWKWDLRVHVWWDAIWFVHQHSLLLVSTIGVRVTAPCQEVIFATSSWLRVIGAMFAATVPGRWQMKLHTLQNKRPLYYFRNSQTVWDVTFAVTTTVLLSIQCQCASSCWCITTHGTFISRVRQSKKAALWAFTTSGTTRLKTQHCIPEHWKFQALGS